MVDGTIDSSSFRGTIKIDGYSEDGQILLKRVANLRAATIRSVFSRQLLKTPLLGIWPHLKSHLVIAFLEGGHSVVSRAIEE